MSAVPPPLPVERQFKIPLAVAGTSLVLLSVSLAFPAVILEDKTVLSGGYILCLGWLGIFLGLFAWLANPLLFISWLLLLFNRWIGAFVVSAAAVLFGLFSLSVIGSRVPLDEAGVRTSAIAHLGPAFPCWMAALAIPGIGAILLQFRSRRRVGKQGDLH